MVVHEFLYGGRRHWLERMKVHPGRILEIVMGLVILATIFLIPFGSKTLYGTVGPLLGNIGGFQASASGA